MKYQSDLAVTGARFVIVHLDPMEETIALFSSSSWCGNTITPAWSNVTAQGNTMVVIFRANNYINTTTRRPQTGFRATIFFG